MKVKILKKINQCPTLPNLMPGEIRKHFTDALIGDVKVPASLLIEQGFIEEVKETPKPRWKVGDYAVCKYETLGEIDYIKIYKVNKSDKDSFYYNDEYKETCLRDPTPEELSTYFR